MKILTLKACDTCHKALGFLSDEGIEVENHDIRQDGLPDDVLRHVVQTAGWEKAVNKRSTTWRNLDEADKVDLDDEKAIALITTHPTLMKRPVFLVGDEVLIGFDNAMQAELVRRFG